MVGGGGGRGEGVVLVVAVVVVVVVVVVTIAEGCHPVISVPAAAGSRTLHHGGQQLLLFT